MRLRMIWIGSLVAMLSLMAGSPASAGGNLVTNGDFETGDFTGWTLSGNDSPFMSVQPYIGGTYVPNTGSYFADLGPVGSLGYLSQDIATVAGASYTFSWYLASDGDTTNEFSASWNGTTIFDQVNIPYQTYQLYSFTETATGATTTISFGAENDPGFLSLDTISVSSAVPEPSSMVLACMGGLSLAVVASLRRRRGARAAV